MLRWHPKEKNPTMSVTGGFTLAKATLSEVNVISSLEAASFPADEAASPEAIHARISEAGDFFWTYRRSGESELVGFVNGTCTLSEVIHHESMSKHEASGRTLVVHSVTISPNERRKGLGSQMFIQYIQEMATNTSIDRVLLLSKSDMLTFYVNCGFKLFSLSNVSHGQDKWFEMGLDLLDLRAVEQIQVDAFAEVPFSGNPAAVIFEHRDDLWMQNVAMENNLAETSFVSLVPDKPNTYALRWFTPAKEIELCGHATLAAAHALYETRRVPLHALIRFETVYSGVLTAQGRPDGNIEMSFPLTAVFDAPEFPAERKQSLLTALSITSEELLFVGSSKFDVVAEVSRAAFARLATTNINYGLLAEQGGRGVLITALGGARAEQLDLQSLSLNGQPEGVRAPRADIVNDKRFDFVSRCFFPLCGVNEDPVTGSAHCSLAPYWAAKLLTAEEQEQSKTLMAYQASARGGVLQLNVKGDRVVMAGPAVTTMRTKVVV